ncbi:unnamed protein product [Caenorhabditis angaria]|uniref:Nudix hydrolase domain-containing protein n=1 Tax=Caenorhabditis angaria TaxID=860376 RepID=A0A9P1I8B6_9PELO|nr:unnamed protein product [Caenorhabditis angaria]
MCLGKLTTTWKSASSIILASTKSRRILMLKRGNTASFMPNSMVFPGGIVEKSDAKFGEQYRIAAIRELFEESGVLLTKNGFETSDGNEDLKKIKMDIVKNSDIFENFKNKIDADQLIEWDTFLTPATNPKRFFTKFFVALVEDEPQIDLCTSEMSEYVWVDPLECVKNAFDGKFTLPPPQVYELTRLSQVNDWKKLENFGNTKQVICPQPIKTISQNSITNTFPGDYLYIDSDCFNQPLRQLPSEEIAVFKDKPTHRATYQSKPIYTKCEIYQHNLESKFRENFHQFETHSKYL